MSDDDNQAADETKQSSSERLQAKLDAISTDKNPDARLGAIISIKLKHPFESGGSTIHFIDFRGPGVLDLRRHGATAQISIKDQSFKFDMDVICLHAEALGALGKNDANKIDMLDGDDEDPTDFDRVKEVILVFFPVL